jgi:hypothetical protein
MTEKVKKSFDVYFFWCIDLVMGRGLSARSPPPSDSSIVSLMLAKFLSVFLFLSLNSPNPPDEDDVADERTIRLCGVKIFPLKITCGVLLLLVVPSAAPFAVVVVFFEPMIQEKFKR